VGGEGNKSTDKADMALSRILSANFAVVVFLALKNTPLAFLSAYSYERLNGLHQIAGYTSFVYLVLHASMYSCYFLANDRAEMLQTQSAIAGIVAGFAFLGVVASAVMIRRIWYEAFYVSHIIFFIVALVGAVIHQPELEDGLVIIFALIAGMWGADRLLRASRLCVRAVNNEAIIEPLPNGGTKIILTKKPHGLVPGKHCFLWIPKIRLLEAHPFTVVASEPMEFVVNSYDGFTRDLREYALAHPGARVKASVDGPYGTFPDPLEYDKVVLIAGGSGASFTFGLAVNLLERMGPEASKTITFIWGVRKHGEFTLFQTHLNLLLQSRRCNIPRIWETLSRPRLIRIWFCTDNLSWFSQHLNTLRTHEHSPKVNVSLYITAAPANDSAEQRRGSVLVTDIRQMHRAPTTSSSYRASERSLTRPSGDNDMSEKALERGILTTKTIENEGNDATTADSEKAMGLSPHQQRSASDSSLSTAYSAGGWTAAADEHRDVLKSGRPDTATLIREAVRSTPRNQRVLIAACGPNGLMRVVRDTTASLITADGPGVELHCEQFGW
jgi:predicted ferric reductase